MVFQKGNKLGLATRFKSGNKNPNWVGDKVSYSALHTYVHKYKPKPEVCEMCKKAKPTDVANISGKYLRDLDDWWWLCRKCHIKSDGRLEQFIKRLESFEHERDPITGRYKN